MPIGQACARRAQARVLRGVFGHDGFRPGQAEAVEAFAAGRDVQVLLPTGGGKSVCYQVPAVCAARSGGGPTLVISPLVALMEDQVRALTQRGVRAACLHRGVRASERRAILAEARALDLLYVAPERLAGARFRRELSRAGVGRVAVDEAHCISEWGHDFRPQYSRIGDLRAELDVPFLAATATATPQVMGEIRTSLALRDPVVVQGSFLRPNLSMAVELLDGDKARVERVADLLAARGLGRDPAAGRAVVYAATRKRVRDVAAQLKKLGVRAGFYHAGRTDLARARAHAAFDEGRVSVLVATTAFGMGIDRPDVRLVAHVQAPGTLAAWYQQAGRAGRDGAPADCVLLYGPSDGRTHARLRGEHPTPGSVAGYRALVDWAHATGCRQQGLVHYFTGTEVDPCGCCDACTDPGAVADGVGAARARGRARTAARAERTGREAAVTLDAAQRDQVVAFVDALRKPVGRTVLAGGLRGSRAKRIARARLDGNPLFGALRGVPERAIVAAVDELLAEGRLARRGKKYPTVWIPDKRVRPPRTAAAKRPPERGLSAALRNFRRREARRRRWKAYQVFPNAALTAIVAARPATTDELLAIRGMGPTRVARFGVGILELVAAHPVAPPAGRVS